MVISAARRPGDRGQRALLAMFDRRSEGRDRPHLQELEIFVSEAEPREHAPPARWRRPCASGDVVRHRPAAEWCNAAVSSAVGGGRRGSLLITILRDISDRKRAEEANDRLAHVSRLAVMGELTASIATRSTSRWAPSSATPTPRTCAAPEIHCRWTSCATSSTTSEGRRSRARGDAPHALAAAPSAS
jgi:hypothetical protein